MNDAQWSALWEWSDTQAEVDAKVSRASQAIIEQERAAKIAAWRARNPQATCSDRVALELAWLESAFGRLGQGQG